MLFLLGWGKLSISLQLYAHLLKNSVHIKLTTQQAISLHKTLDIHKVLANIIQPWSLKILAAPSIHFASSPSLFDLDASLQVMERLGKHISFPGVRRRFQQFSLACTLTFCQANFPNLLHLNYVGGEAFAGVITCAKDGVSSYKAWNTPIFRRQMARLNLPALAKLTRSRYCSQDLICHFYFEY